MLLARCNKQKIAYQTDPIRSRVLLEVLHQMSIRHPLHNKLERICRSVNKGDDVRVTQPFHLDGRVDEGLQNPGISMNRRSEDTGRRMRVTSEFREVFSEKI